MKDDEFIAFVKNKLQEKLPRNISEKQKKKYYIRLEQEIDVVFYLDLKDCFLLMSELVRKIKGDFTVVGAENGSLLAWVLGITNVDPIKYDLVFGRFLNDNSKILNFGIETSPFVASQIVKIFDQKQIVKIEELEYRDSVLVKEIYRSF